MEYRKITINSDLSQLMELEKFWLSIGEKPWNKDNFLKKLKKKWDWSLAAVSGNKIVGYIINSQSENNQRIMLGHKLVVDINYRNQGIAENLVFLTNKNADCDLVIGKVNFDNLAAQKFWEKQGFIFCETVDCDDGRKRIVIKYLKTPIEHSKPYTGKEECNFVKKLLLSQNLSKGNIRDFFETIACNFFQKKYCLTTSSGSEALRCLAKFYSKPFIVPSFCCSSIYNNIDCIPKDVDEIGNLLKPKKPSLTLGLHSWCDQLSWTPTVDDRTWNLEAKSDSDFTIVSLGATKMLTAAKGGLILTDSLDLFRKIKKIPNECISDIHAAIGICQFEKYDKIKKIKQKLQILYQKKNILNIGNSYRFIFKVRDSNRTVINAKKCNINICHPVDLPLHLYKNLSGNFFPNTEMLWNNWVSLPFHCKITNNDIDNVYYFLKQNEDL